jgi:hypothetical protein
VLVTLAFTLAISLAIALGGCGAAEEQDFGVSHGERPPRPVELELRATDGAFVAIGDLRGRATVVYCFATYDGVSQAAVRPLSRFVRHHPEVNVVAIATQPNPQIFAEAWQAALSPPFLVTFDPEERIISAVPTYILLDANGVEVDRHVGFASQNRLEGMLAQAETR